MNSPVLNSAVDMRSGKPPVSVVIVNYNAGSLLAECVRTALAQAEQVVVGDNDSSDSSMDMPAVQFAAAPRLEIALARRRYTQPWWWVKCAANPGCSYCGIQAAHV